VENRIDERGFAELMEESADRHSDAMRQGRADLKDYVDVVSEVKAFLEQRLEFARDNGVAESKTILDPGIGFGKTLAHNLELIRRLDELVALGRPVMIGASRKSFLGRITGQKEASKRVPGTIAVNVLAFERGARVFRVHDVAPTVDALTVAAATVGSGARAGGRPRSRPRAAAG